MLLNISNLHSLTQIAYKEICCKPVLYKNKPFFTNIKLFLHQNHSYSRQTYVILPCNSTHIQKLIRVSNLCSLIHITYKKICLKPFYVTIADADIKSLKSLHTLFDKYLDHMLVQFEQYRMVQTIQNFELFDKKW